MVPIVMAQDRDPVGKGFVASFGTTGCKNKKPRTLALVGELKEILERRLEKRLSDCPYVFHRNGKPIKYFRAGFKAGDRKLNGASMGTKKGLILLAGAWVLWAQDTNLSNSTTTWEAVDGFPAYEQCANAQSGYVNAENKHLERITEENQKLIWSYNYQCLPDTIDPRAPKTTRDKN